MPISAETSRAVQIEELIRQRKMAGAALENIALVVSQMAMLHDSFDRGEMTAEQLSTEIWTLVQRIDEQLLYQPDLAMCVEDVPFC